MAVKALDKMYQNDQVFHQASAVKTVTIADMEAAGDILVLGVSAPVTGALIHDIRVVVDEVFDGSVSLDLGYYDTVNETFNALVTGITGLTDRAVYAVPLGTDGNYNHDGSAPITEATPVMWGGSTIAFKVNAVGGDTGSLKLVITYTDFYAKDDGKYGLASIPMRPARA
jgi:hypothetical protein